MEREVNEKALVLFSGGQDSATCLAWACTHFDHVETVGFAYGQVHSVELDCRIRVRTAVVEQFPDWGAKLGPDHMLDLAELGRISDTALTRDAEITMAENGLPTTFVPGRNLVFVTYAAALAYRRGIETLVGGMCETDFSGYPDCRDETLQSLIHAVSLGMDRRYRLDTPLMWLNKQETWELARKLGGEALVELIREETHTCYRGDRSQRHDWGYGCGTCPACELRAKGHAAFVEAAQA